MSQARGPWYSPLLALGLLLGCGGSGQHGTAGSGGAGAKYAGFSGFGYVSTFMAKPQSVSFDVEARAGTYQVDFRYSAMTGAASCAGEDARIALSGANEAGERVNANILLKGDGAASWRVSVLSRSDQTLAALAAAGFAPNAADGAMGYGEDTRWFP